MLPHVNRKPITIQPRRIVLPKSYSDKDDRTPLFNDIGRPGEKGFGVGIYPLHLAPLPLGFSEMEGTKIIGHDNYGNYQYKDGSIMCWIPKFYYRWGVKYTDSLEIASDLDYVDREAAEVDGFTLHRAFIDGGVVQTGFFYDKYFNSLKDNRPVSVKGEVPYHFNESYEYSFPNSDIMFPQASHSVEIGKLRGSDFFTSSCFIRNTMAMLSLAHGQASTNDYYCAWYNSSNSDNHPKGCNTFDNSNPKFYDYYDSNVEYEYVVSNGAYRAKTGTASNFAKTTHNGQKCGVCDLNGLRNEIVIGATYYGTSWNDNSSSNPAGLYFLKEEIKCSKLTGFWGSQAGDYTAFGNSDDVKRLYTYHVVPKASDRWLRTSGSSKYYYPYLYFSTKAFHTISSPTYDDWVRRCAGFPDNRVDTYSGSNNNPLFGYDKLYRNMVSTSSTSYPYIKRNTTLGYGMGRTTDSNNQYAGVWANDSYISSSDKSIYFGYRCARYA